MRLRCRTGISTGEANYIRKQFEALALIARGESISLVPGGEEADVEA